MSREGKPTGYIQLLRENANFRMLWLGQIVSLFGDWFNLIASAALVATLTESGFAVGGLFVVRMLAPFLVSPIAGVVADRYSRKTVLLWTDILRGVTVFGFLLVRDASWVWLLYALTAIQLGISGFFFTARTAILPDLVDRAASEPPMRSPPQPGPRCSLSGPPRGPRCRHAGDPAAFAIDGLTFSYPPRSSPKLRCLPQHEGTSTIVQSELFFPSTLKAFDCSARTRICS